MKIAFSGAAGTGKTTLAKDISEKLQLHYVEVGSRSVAREMGYKSPYDVDRDGKRLEFQKSLLEAKIKYESERNDFVTDRTTLDQLAYTYIHLFECGKLEQMPRDIMDDLHSKAVEHMDNYDMIFFCGMNTFWCPTSDGVRRVSYNYHRMYESMLYGLYKLNSDFRFNFFEIEHISYSARIRQVSALIDFHNSIKPFT
jgi:nicotinamide riboside kinase